MVRYSLFDTLPFIFLGTVVLFGFSLAFTVLSKGGYVNCDGSECEKEEEFATIPNAFQTLFYACLGNIEAEVSLCLSLLSEPTSCALHRRCFSSRAASSRS